MPLVKSASKNAFQVRLMIKDAFEKCGWRNIFFKATFAKINEGKERFKKQWDVINKNRFYDFPKVDEGL